MGDPWGIGGFRGGESPILSKSSKKSVKKSEKAAKSEKKLKILEKSDIFFTENGLKCIRNPMKHF